MINKSHSRLGFIGSLAAHSLLFGGLWAAFQHSKPVRYEEVSSISLELIAARLEQEQVAVSPDADENAEESVTEKVELEPAKEEVVEETTEPEPTPMPEPKAEPVPVAKPEPKPKEKPKPKEPPKEKPKPEPKKVEKPKPEVKKAEVKKSEPKKAEVKKAEPKKAVKALEKGAEAKQGVVAKAIPNAHQGTRNQAGIPNGSPNGNNPSINQAGSPNGTLNGGSAGQGQGKANSNGEHNAYRTTLLRALQQRANSSYPQREKMMRKMGTVVLKFNLSPSGQISNVQVVKSSGYENLDAAAVKAAQSTKPPAPPSGFPNAISVPVRFVVQ